MSKSIPREFIDKLIEMSDIVGIIGTYVDLRQSSGQYRSKCPFHDGDNITTFSVSPQKGIYHCFKCNERRKCNKFPNEIPFTGFY